MINYLPAPTVTFHMQFKVLGSTHNRFSSITDTSCKATPWAKAWVVSTYDDVIKRKHFPPFVRGIHRSPGNSRHKGQWRGALMFPLICAWINGWVNNSEAGYLRRHRAHYDVIVMNIVRSVAQIICKRICFLNHGCSEAWLIFLSFIPINYFPKIGLTLLPISFVARWYQVITQSSQRCMDTLTNAYTLIRGKSEMKFWKRMIAEKMLR